MQRLEVSDAVRLIYKSLGVKGLKEPEREADHSVLCGTELKNEWSCEVLSHVLSWCSEKQTYLVLPYMLVFTLSRKFCVISLICSIFRALIRSIKYIKIPTNALCFTDVIILHSGN